MRKMRPIITLPASAALLACVLAFSGCYASSQATAQEAPDTRPNIVYIFTDDADHYIMNGPAMADARTAIGGEGMTFPNTFYAEPLCCPSRTSMFRGQYSHNSGVYSNQYPQGSWRTFYENGLQNETYATMLHNAGYRTFFAGKVMNGYDLGKGAPTPPMPGFDVFRGRVDGNWDEWNSYRYEDGSIKTFSTTSGGTSSASSKHKVCHKRRHHKGCTHKKHRAKSADFANALYGLNDKLVADWATSFIENSPTGEPFAAVLAMHAPHVPEAGPDSYKNHYNSATVPKPPSYEEADMSDKPLWMQSLGTSSQSGALNESYRDRLRSAEYADAQMMRVINALKAKGEFDNTIFIVYSDNGYHIRLHRLGAMNHGGKMQPYLEDVRDPMWVRGPGIPADVMDEHLISSIDFISTFADIAGTTPPQFVDGRSWLPLARGEDIAWRKFAYSEILGARAPHPWHAVYDEDYAYHDWFADGEAELYNLRTDPYELDNILYTGPDNRVAADMRQKAQRMSTCVAQECRDIEGG